MEDPAVKIGDTVEFTLNRGDLIMTGVVLGITREAFYGNSVFTVWTDAFGGMLSQLPLSPSPFVKKPWRLLHRPRTLEEARHRMLLARASFEKKIKSNSQPKGAVHGAS